ncbi:hypothetical protein [Streptomyces lunaelactis]|uniref:hypothetical protein n=2 Tax=Streptomyces TaxID=1883 RepID=UPI0015844AC0|nr:hypothetical protein [Streptomyces lunaelactis]NUK20151.1 hypothetical protein [Streptomyces lunaelactis]
MTNDSADQRVQDALRRHAFWRTSWLAETALSAVMSDEVRRLAGEIEQEEFRLGQELSTRLQPLQERYERTVTDFDVELFTRICPGKHGRWGRICLMDADHEMAGEPHWGRTADGRLIAWVGSAPDD